MASSTWSPAQYERFHRERSAPFYDLLALVKPEPGMRVLDLGCGTGELTHVLHTRLQAASTVGLDSSETMLAKSAAYAGQGLRFEHARIEEALARPGETYNLVFSNAALQWVEDHPGLFGSLARSVAVGGQLAVQMPANFDHPSHAIARALAETPHFRAELRGWKREPPVLAPEAYVELLHRHGFSPQHVRLQIYAHLLPSAEEVVEWVKGTLLTDYQARLPAERYPEFLAAYRERLLQELGNGRPYLYAFKRILLWGQKRQEG